MNNEVGVSHIPGATQYGTVVNSVMQYWNQNGTPAFESASAGDVGASVGAGYAITATYDNVMLDVITWPPAMAAGFYTLWVRQMVGASPSVSDIVTGEVTLYWDGTNLHAPPAGVDWSLILNKTATQDLSATTVSGGGGGGGGSSADVLANAFQAAA